MAQNSQGRFALRKPPGKPFFTIDTLKYAAIFLYLVLIIANVIGFYPVMPASAIAAFIIYAAFFAAAYFIEKRKTDDPKVETRAYYIVFLVFISAANITGGIGSPVKWIPYIVVFMFIVKGYYMHAGTALVFLFISLAKHISGFAVHDHFSFAAMAGLIAVYYFTEKKPVQQKTQEESFDIQSGKEPADFKVIAYDLLENLIKVYNSLLRSRSLLFYFKDPSSPDYFELMACSTVEEGNIDEGFKIHRKEGLLGAASRKGDYFSFEIKTVKPDYYKKKTEAQSCASLPVSLNSVIGLIVADFSREISQENDYIKINLKNLSAEIIRIMQLFEINSRVMEKEKRVSLLYEIYGRLNLLETKKEIVREFFRQLKGFDVYSGYLAEYDTGERAFEITEAYNYPPSVAGSKIGARDDEIVKHVHNSGMNLIVKDAASKNLSLNFGRKSIDKFFISVMKKGNVTYGFIKLDKEEGFDFTDFEIKTLEMIFSRIGLLLENAGLYEKIKRQATRDGLTGLYNHLTFQEKLGKLMGKRDHGEIKWVSLFFLDIDFFKKFNDSFGHQEGDRVLIRLAAALEEFAEKNEGTFAARYGGEEFVFVLEDYDIYRASKVAEDIRRHCEQNLTGGNETERRKITLSIGVTTYPDYARNTRDIIKNADEALYLAKEEGRNRVKSVIDVKNKQKQ